MSKSLEIAYIAQQQLKSFNLPYQLGYSPIEEYMSRFESPSDADTASIPLFENDVVLLATDGKFVCIVCSIVCVVCIVYSVCVDSVGCM